MQHIAVVISAYNNPDYLRLVLAGYKHQTDQKFSMYIADDGSSGATRELIEEFSASASFPVHHIWQEDLGFRKARVHNQVFRKLSEDYVLLTDGDCVPGPTLIATHKTLAKEGFFYNGSRVLLNQKWTEQLIASRKFDLGSISVTAWLKHRIQKHINRLLPVFTTPGLSKPGTSLKGIRGCHLGCWRADLLTVNGFDESFEGWGREDSDLTARLLHAGIARRNVRGSPVFHLWHTENNRNKLPENDSLLQSCLNEKRVRAIKGLDELDHA